MMLHKIRLTAGLLALSSGVLPGAALAATPSEALKDYSASASDQVISLSQLSDVQPTDWAYQALSNLVERYGCISGFPDGRFKGSQPISRYEAAALLNSCLDRVSQITDDLRRLMQEFDKELVTVRGRVNRLQMRLDTYEAQRFAPTTKLGGSAVFALGAFAYGGHNLASIENYLASLGANGLSLRKGASLNYNITFNLDTSYTGKDLLSVSLRAGNFGPSAMAGRIVPLGQQAAAYEPDAGANILGVEKIAYKFPVGKQFTVVIGPRVGQGDLLALNPVVYPKDANLTAFTYKGAPGVYNGVKGPGAGLIWKRKEWMASFSYSASRGNNGSTFSSCTGLTYDEEDEFTCTKGSLGGNLFSDTAGGASTLQVGYGKGPWKLGAAWTYSNASVGVSGSTPLAASAIPSLLQGGGFYNAFGLAGSWEPKKANLIPSISVGAGINFNNYGSSFNDAVMIQGQSLMAYRNWSSSISESWFVGLQWKNAFAKGNYFGVAIGQPNFIAQATGPNQQTLYFSDGQYAMEAWYTFQVTDKISITPAIFYLSNPYGDVATVFGGGYGSPFSVFGAVLKSTFKF
jgi:hypothetical protein